MSTVRFGIGTLLLACALHGCDGNAGAPAEGDGGASSCIAALDLDCTPAYQPTYDRIFEGLLRPKCATSSVCHSGDKAPRGLDLSNHDAAYDYLLGNKGGRARVVPDKPECSILVQRLESNDPSFRMPSGSTQLELGDRCVVRQWIANGAMK